MAVARRKPSAATRRGIAASKRRSAAGAKPTNSAASAKPPKTAASATPPPPLPTVTPKPIGRLELLPMGSVQASPLNPRRAMEPASLALLADDIAVNGLLQPILVRPGKKADRYEIILGARRHAAMVLLQKDGRLPDDAMIAARVREASDFDLVLLAAAENLQREDLTPLEEGVLYDNLRKHVSGPGRPEAQIAAMLHVGERTVFKRLALRRLDPAVADALQSGKIGIRQAEAFTLGEPAAQRARLKEILRGDNDWDAEPGAIRRAMVAKRIPVAHALFDPDLYTGEIIEAVEDGTRYFTDAAAFTKLQDAAIDAKLKALATDWHWVKRLKPNEPHYNYPQSTRRNDKEAGAILWIDRKGEVNVQTNVLTPQLADKRHKAEEAARRRPTAKSGAAASADAEPATPARLLTDAQAKFCKAAKTRALRRALAYDPKAALACAVLALVGHCDEIRITGTPATFGSNRDGEVDDDEAFMTVLRDRAAPLLAALAERRSALEAAAKARGHDFDEDDDEFFDEHDDEEHETDAAAVPRVAQHVLPGEERFAGAAQAQFLTALLALPLEDLLALHAALVARRAGCWWSYQDRVAENPFAVTLALAVDARRFLPATWSPTEDFFKALAIPRLRGLVERAGLVTELNRQQVEWSALPKAKKGVLVAACLEAPAGTWTPDLFPEVQFLGEAALRLALGAPAPDDDVGADEADTAPLDPADAEAAQ